MEWRYPIATLFLSELGTGDWERRPPAVGKKDGEDADPPRHKLFGAVYEGAGALGAQDARGFGAQAG